MTSNSNTVFYANHGHDFSNRGSSFSHGGRRGRFSGSRGGFSGLDSSPGQGILPLSSQALPSVHVAASLGGGNSRKRAVIIGVVVGVVGLLILIVGFFPHFKLSRKPEAARRGDILGAAELQGPLNYKYKDLKSATKNFSEENKLGEGGFGDI
ncbi:hypothetical protein ACE6H2_011484 [Prunus campanulata]